eukprot:351257-Chlamydomonas_euryale.AAC.5
MQERCRLFESWSSSSSNSSSNINGSSNRSRNRNSIGPMAPTMATATATTATAMTAMATITETETRDRKHISTSPYIYTIGSSARRLGRGDGQQWVPRASSALLHVAGSTYRAAVPSARQNHAHMPTCTRSPARPTPSPSHPLAVSTCHTCSPSGAVSIESSAIECVKWWTLTRMVAHTSHPVPTPHTCSPSRAFSIESSATERVEWWTLTPTRTTDGLYMLPEASMRPDCVMYKSGRVDIYSKTVGAWRSTRSCKAGSRGQSTL